MYIFYHNCSKAARFEALKMHLKIHKSSRIGCRKHCGHFIASATADLLSMHRTAAGVDQRYWRPVEVNQECLIHTRTEVRILRRYLED